MKGERGFNFSISVLVVLVVGFYILLFLSSFAIVSFGEIKTALFTPDIRFAVKLSIVTAAAVTVISIFISVPSAYALSRLNIPLKGVLDTLIDIPIALSPVAIGAMVLMFLNTHTGRWVEENVLQFLFEIPGIILVQAIIVIPLSIRILKSHFDTVPESYELVARSLGYSRTASFIYVVLPLSRNAILAAMLTSFAKALGEFGATVTVAGAISNKTQTLPISIFLSLSNADLNMTFVLIMFLVFIALLNMVLIRALVGKGIKYD